MAGEMEIYLRDHRIQELVARAADADARLLDSPIEGEREAAQAALDRLVVTPPAPGSPQWIAAMIEHQRMVSECAIRINDAGLTPAEITTIRRWTRFIGRPWEDGAEELRRIHRQLMNEEPVPIAIPDLGKMALQLEHRLVSDRWAKTSARRLQTSYLMHARWIWRVCWAGAGRCMLPLPSASSAAIRTGICCMTWRRD